MPVQLCRRLTTSTEFLKWQEYLDNLCNVVEKQDYYLAQIAQEIRRVNKKNPGRIKLDPFLIRFKPKRVQPDRSVTKETRAARSKAFWGALTGTAKAPPKKGNKNGPRTK